MRIHKRSRDFRRGLSSRLSQAIDKHLEVDIRELARLLGYANPTTLYAARRGQTFLDTERLARFATLKTRSGGVVDLHWLVTGQGGAVRMASTSGPGVKRRAAKLLDEMSDAELQALLTLLGTRGRQGRGGSQAQRGARASRQFRS